MLIQPQLDLQYKKILCLAEAKHGTEALNWVTLCMVMNARVTVASMSQVATIQVAIQLNLTCVSAHIWATVCFAHFRTAFFLHWLRDWVFNITRCYSVRPQRGGGGGVDNHLRRWLELPRATILIKSLQEELMGAKARSRGSCIVVVGTQGQAEL